MKSRKLIGIIETRCKWVLFLLFMCGLNVNAVQYVAAGRYAITTSVALRSDSVMLGGFVGTESVASERDWDLNVTVLDGEDATRCVVMDGMFFAQLDGFVATRGFLLG